MKYLIIFILLCLVAAGCVKVTVPSGHLEGDGGPLTPTYVVPSASSSDPLDGTRWELLAFENAGNLFHLPGQPRFFVQFEKGELFLYGGCNSISGHYIIKDKHITITFVKQTEMDCSYLGPMVNEVEEMFTSAMPTFDTYSIEDGKLRIQYNGGVLLLHRVTD